MLSSSAVRQIAAGGRHCSQSVRYYDTPETTDQQTTQTQCALPCCYLGGPHTVQDFLCGLSLVGSNTAVGIYTGPTAVAVK